MSQLTIYLDEESLSRVKTAAERERLSVSKNIVKIVDFNHI